MKFTKENSQVKIAQDLETEENELRLVLNDGRDLFFGAGGDTVEESVEILKADEKWRERLIIIQKLSKKGQPYEMAILSNLKTVETLDL